jgi:sugar/nucleoside kinase (ribokinase family)
VERCLDTTGAGDTFAASFIAALLEERPLEECAAFANASASICVEHLGATTARIERDEAERRMREILKNR